VKPQNDKDAEWSQGVKIRDGWCCEGCGALDRRFLESCHIEPKEFFPQLRHKLSNGKCGCLWLHAYMHRVDIGTQNLILIRLVKKLTERLYRPLTKCQKRLFGIENEEA